MSHDYDYDLLTIGAGSGGLSVIERAASYGRRCAVVERGKIGGTCVNVGCVPKKIMWFGANIAHMIGDAANYGFDLECRGFDWARLVARRETYISNINDYYHGYMKELGVDEIVGDARFVDSHTLEAGGRQYSAEHIVIATGTRPRLPDTPGIEHAITSDGFFELRELPASTLRMVSSRRWMRRGSAIAPPDSSCTQIMSRAMPSRVVKIFASTMFMPRIAQAPAKREKRPGWSCA